MNTAFVLGSHCQLGQYGCVIVFNTIYISDTSAEPLGDFREDNYNYFFLLLMVPQKSNDHTCSADLAPGEQDIQWLSSFLQPCVCPEPPTGEGWDPWATSVLPGTGRHNNLPSQNMAPQSRLYPPAAWDLQHWFQKGIFSVCRNKSKQANKQTPDVSNHHKKPVENLFKRLASICTL